MGFRYQAIDASGQTLSDVIDAASAAEAADQLRERGLFVTRLDGDEGEKPVSGTRRATGEPGRGVKLREVVLFAQQMSMLLRTGAQVVDALQVVEEQANRPAWRSVVSALLEDVEEGKPLSVALTRFPQVFSSIFVSMVTAGEASGELSVAFDRLGVLTRQQQEIRNRVVGAMSYPIVLLALCGAVIVVMLTFVLPRFAEMFEVLDVELPMSTSILIASSKWSQAHWPYLLVGTAALVFGTIAFFRSDTGKAYVSLLVVRVPLFGGLVRDIIFARICRIWGQLLESRVGLLDAVELVENGTANVEFRALIGRIRQAVTDGNRIGPEIKGSWLVPGTFAGALATGEESGRLSDALLFIAASLEDQNSQALGSLTRVIEPLILSFMGLVVGTLAFSLFLPMFDMASMGG